MAADITAVNNALQKVILPYVQDNLPKSTILLDKMKRNATTTFFNNNFYAPIRSTRQGGVTNLSTDSAKLNSSYAQLQQASVPVKIVTGTFDVTDLMVEATKSTKGAVENQLKFQAKALATDLARWINRQFYSDSYGIVAEVSGSTNSTTFTVQLPTSSDQDTRLLDVYGTVNGDIANTKYLTPGQIIAVGSAGTAVGTISTVTSGNPGTVVTTGGIASAANYPVYVVDGGGAGAGTSEFSGIRSALSSSTGTSTYAGVARNASPVWTPQFGSVAESLTLTRMENSYIAAREYAQNGDSYAFFVNKTLYRKYGDLLTAMRRTVNEIELTGGWKGLSFEMGAGEVAVFLDYDVPDGEVVCINFDTWQICQVTDVKWLEDPSTGTGNLFRKTDYLTYQATMVWYANLICLAPAANGRETQKTA